MRRCETKHGADILLDGVYYQVSSESELTLLKRRLEGMGGLAILHGYQTRERLRRERAMWMTHSSDKNA